MKDLENINKKIIKINKKVYIVGGYTREKILNGNYSGDIDLATDATPDEIKNIFNISKEVGKKYGTIIIKEGKKTYEITTFRKDIGILDNRRPVNVEFTDNLELDSKRRDFTFNSIYYNIEKKSFIDPQNGIKDLKDKLIKFIGNPENRIKEDALRILRFIRFKNKYNFVNGKSNYFEILKKHIGLLENISIERIKEEFDKILLLENNIQALKDLKQIGFFKLILPEIEKLEITPGGKNHHLEGNVWIHTLMTIKELNIIFNKGFEICNKEGDKTIKYYKKSEKINFYWTMLLHDISKYETYSIDKNSIVHYYNHEKLGAEKSKIILKKFKFSKHSTKKIIWLIENHLKIFKIFEMKILKSRKLMINKYFQDLIIVGVSDHLGRIPTDNNLIYKLKDYYINFIIILKNKKFLTGNDVLKKYPKLKGIAIRNKLNDLNNEILIK